FTFTEHVYTTDESSRVSPVDLDHDGDLDIVADGVWYENDGSQNLTPHTTLVGGHSQPIDLDGDGDIDIVSSGEINTDDGRQTSVYLLENDGAENFTSTQIVLSTRSTTMSDFRGPSLEVIDLDRDGDLDIPYADHGRVGVLMNDGQQNFTDQIL
ncbi:MAG: FG-GAP-like repeat-containing protein, partial [bacterium]